jgi:hypothetical protein
MIVGRVAFADAQIACSREEIDKGLDAAVEAVTAFRQIDFQRSNGPDRQLLARLQEPPNHGCGCDIFPFPNLLDDR